MAEFLVQAGSGTSKIVVGQPLAALPEKLGRTPDLVVCDEHVAALLPGVTSIGPFISIPGGERVKSIAWTEKLYQSFLERDLDRSSWVMAIGGGTVCDLVAFCASTYMRGVNCVLAPTTLLAQVDAGVGGKNGVNFGGLKNIIGTIRQPQMVYCDTALLRSLPEKEIRSGYAEIIKAGVIADAELFAFLAKNAGRLLGLDQAAVDFALERALRVKAAIVEADEREQSDRVKLNFGHTFGHAIEVLGDLAHGEAVSVGMAFDAELSVRYAGFTREAATSLRACLESFHLPLSYGRAEPMQILAAVRHDKKR